MGAGLAKLKLTVSLMWTLGSKCLVAVSVAGGGVGAFQPQRVLSIQNVQTTCQELISASVSCWPCFFHSKSWGLSSNLGKDQELRRAVVSTWGTGEAVPSPGMGAGDL